MAATRIDRVTRCGFAVLLAGALLLPVSARGEGDAVALEPDRALRQVLRDDLPLAERLAAARAALGPAIRPTDAPYLEAGLALLEEAPATGLWLLQAARDGRFLADAEAERVRGRSAELLEGARGTPAQRAIWSAAGLLGGRRPDDVGATVAGAWPPDAAVRAVLEREVLLPDVDLLPLLDAPDPAPIAAALAVDLPVTRALDLAERDDLDASRRGLDALYALGAASVSRLTVEVERGASDRFPGRAPRAARAALVLGVLGDRRATGALLRALEASDGWLQAAAATALGDLQDPAAAVGLCHKIAYRGDVLRPRDQWDWPGERETVVPRDAWSTVEYFVVDCLAADALLRLGVRNAAGWLIREKLDPGKANFRIRVLQDTVDSLLRALPPDAPVAAYGVDQGLPQRRRAFAALAAWWFEHRHDGWPQGRRLDERDAGFREEARRMVERLRGRSVMELQISQESCALLGTCVTPTLLETLGAAQHPVLRTEIARALGVVDDLRAVDALVALLADPTPFVRATAAESLGAYLDRAEARERVQAALLPRLDDSEPAVCVAALKALVAAPPSARLREAVRTHGAEAHRQRFGVDDREVRMAETVARLVQEGWDAWPPIRDGLADPQRYVRLAWWDLLRRAVGLPPHVYDALTDPSEPTWTPLEENVVRRALDTRRGG